jgi:hypothetical protein
MDRYSILLGKKVEPQKGFWEPTIEHSWNYPDRLRLVVTGGHGEGKTSYLIKDAIETCHDSRCLFVCTIESMHHLASLLTTYKSHLNHESFELCPWKGDSFLKATKGRGFRSIYFDDGDEFDMSDVPLPLGGSLFRLMSLSQNLFSNVPRIIITASMSSISNLKYESTPRGNWNWKIESIRSWGINKKGGL